jgi:hypothetical protein
MSFNVTREHSLLFSHPIPMLTSGISQKLITGKKKAGIFNVAKSPGAHFIRLQAGKRRERERCERKLGGSSGEKWHRHYFISLSL